VFSVFDFDRIGIVEDLSGLSEADAMLREILNSLLVVLLEFQIRFLRAVFR
jgi:hypothetical protein